ncbi:DUF2797 domain-containing protein [Kitasatospora sp. RB6PN24]|uniref:DUF2797 domain-containing protein n=1 Tax=Kitasatospora humi TaxID=2893891 RepID=UPI001E5E2D6E|nr:DUF2797 domain-containing protein [Kitasatospora humi]MCC9307791.1 DUF2797 domain-containing protein [Kitasatospora humi]
MNGRERPGSAWRPIGLCWTPDGQVALEWDAPADRSARFSALPVGGRLAVLVGADRRCLGVRHSGRRIDCPLAAALAPTARHPQCEACSALAATNSVATDSSLLDDKRDYSVYLAHHGELVKVGITRTERGTTRLLEQGALASVFLSSGSLPAARRVERLLGAALGLPDRVSSGRKRRARSRPGSPAERAAALAAAATACQDLNWPSAQARRTPLITDHAHVYPLPDEGLRPAAAVLPVAPGQQLAGTIVSRIGSDLYLATDTGTVLLDVRLLAGWRLLRCPADAEFTAPLQNLPTDSQQDQLF